MAAEANDDEYGIKPSCSISRDTGITLDGGAAAPGRPLGWGPFDPNMPGPFAFFGQPPKCDVAHTSLAQLGVTLVVGNELNSTRDTMQRSFRLATQVGGHR